MGTNNDPDILDSRAGDGLARPGQRLATPAAILDPAATGRRADSQYPMPDPVAQGYGKGFGHLFPEWVNGL